MFRKSYWKKRFAPVLAGALVISSLLVPPGHAFAADPVTSEEQTVSPETPEVKDVTDSTDAATTDANLTTPDSISDSVSDSVAGTSATDASSAKEAAKQDVKETKEAKAADDAVTDPIPDKTPHLVYGDKSLADEDAFVLLIFGDGFTASEQDSFYTNAQNTADYLMDTSPWNEFKDTRSTLSELYRMNRAQKQTQRSTRSRRTQTHATPTSDLHSGQAVCSVFLRSVQMDLRKQSSYQISTFLQQTLML